MNNFRVVAGREPDFERQWRERETYLKEVPGFVQFALLKSDEDGVYVSHTTWKDRAAFEEWTRSANFTAGHRQGSIGGVLAGHPVVQLYDAVLVEGPFETAAS